MVQIIVLHCFQKIVWYNCIVILFLFIGSCIDRVSKGNEREMRVSIQKIYSAV